MKELRPGITGSAETVVDEHNTARAMCSGALPVFATPAMIALMEEAACRALEPWLEPGETSVGTGLEISHLAPSPVGAVIRADCELVQVDRRRLRFSVNARAGDLLIGEGFHERFVVDADRFLKKAGIRPDAL